MSSEGGESTAVERMKNGAQDYLSKDRVDSFALASAVSFLFMLRTLDLSSVAIGVVRTHVTVGVLQTPSVSRSRPSGWMPDLSQPERPSAHSARKTTVFDRMRPRG